MKIIKPFTLSVLHRPYHHQGRNWMALAALGFFRLGEAPGARLLPDAEHWPLALSQLGDGVALDEILPKRQGEALLVGSAHAPGGQPVPCMCVQLQVGAINKSVRVVGNRGWRRSLLAPSRIGPPQPFTSMPLGWERAYGGAGHPGNPYGAGYSAGWGAAQGCMPNLEYAGQPVLGNRRALPAAGFGPLPLDCAPRKGKLGSYDARWLASAEHGLADDIDWSVFNRAPQDQWLPGFFQGGEAYRLQGLHPTLPLIEGRLPAVRARAFLQDRQDSALREAPLALDTVWFLPEQQLGVLVFHGQLPCADSDGLDIGAVMVAYEAAEAPPRPLRHYQRVLTLRGDARRAAQHLFNEAQLAPRLPAEQRARNAALDAATRQSQLEQQQQQLDAQDQAYWQQLGRSAPPGHRPPQAAAPQVRFPTARALQQRDADLGAPLKQARALARQVKRQAASRMAGVLQTAAPPAAPGVAEEYAAALERAVLPAYDLLPAAETGRDPALAEQLARLERLRAQGKLADGAPYQKARQAILAAPAQRRQARRAAPSAPASARLSPQAAALLGAQVRQWRGNGVCLAGRDLAGTDLRGIDLRGADLRETMLEGADLRDAQLARADLRGAVLTGARLAGADLSGAQLAQANLSGCQAAGAVLRQAELRKAHAGGADFSGADLSGALLDQLLAPGLILTGARLDGAHVHRATLTGLQADDSRWRDADLDHTLLPRASLRRSDWARAALTDCSMPAAQCQSSGWDGARWNGLQASGGADFRGATLRGLRAERSGLHSVQLDGASLQASHFRGCDFSLASLAGARLDGARFPDCVFLAASLAGASARGSDWYQALCRKADLRGADLAGAAWVRAELTGAHLPAPEGAA